MVRSSSSTVQSPEPKVQNLKTETVACSHLETVSFKYMGWIKLSVKSTASKRKVGWYATPPTSLVLGLSRLSERFCRCIVPVLTLGHLGHAVTCTARVYHTSKPIVNSMAPSQRVTAMAMEPSAMEFIIITAESVKRS